jgi:hypothetical protein
MSDDTLDARRRVERRMVTLDTVAKGSNGPAQSLTLLNLSPFGFRARGASARGVSPLAPGDHFRFELPRFAGAVAKVVWTDGDDLGGQFPTFVPLRGLDQAAQHGIVEAAASEPGAAEQSYRIEYGPPGDRRMVDCPTALHAIEWYDEIVSAGLPFVRVLNADGDVVSPAFLRRQIAG